MRGPLELSMCPRTSVGLRAIVGAGPLAGVTTWPCCCWQSKGVPAVPADVERQGDAEIARCVGRLDRSAGNGVHQAVRHRAEAAAFRAPGYRLRGLAYRSSHETLPLFCGATQPPASARQASDAHDSRSSRPPPWQDRPLQARHGARLLLRGGASHTNMAGPGCGRRHRRWSCAPCRLP